MAEAGLFPVAAALLTCLNRAASWPEVLVLNSRACACFSTLAAGNSSGHGRSDIRCSAALSHVLPGGGRRACWAGVFPGRTTTTMCAWCLPHASTLLMLLMLARLFFFPLYRTSVYLENHRLKAPSHSSTSASGSGQACSGTHFTLLPRPWLLQATGYGGTVQEGKAVEDKIRRREENPDEEMERAAAAREVTVYFNSDVAGEAFGVGGGRGRLGKRSLRQSCAHTAHWVGARCCLHLPPVAPDGDSSDEERAVSGNVSWRRSVRHHPGIQAGNETERVRQPDRAALPTCRLHALCANACRRHAVAVQAHPAVSQAAPRAVHAGVLHRAQQERQGHHRCCRAGALCRAGFITPSPYMRGCDHASVARPLSHPQRSAARVAGGACIHAHPRLRHPRPWAWSRCRRVHIQRGATAGWPVLQQDPVLLLRGKAGRLPWARGVHNASRASAPTLCVAHMIATGSSPAAWVHANGRISQLKCCALLSGRHAVPRLLQEQKLRPGERIDMPVFFYIDPEFATDPKMKGINTITLRWGAVVELRVADICSRQGTPPG